MARTDTGGTPPKTPDRGAGPVWYRFISTFTGPWTRSNGMAWLKLIVFILVFRWGFIELYSIPSGSMEPTLHGDERFLRGDYVAVNKLSYGPRIPFTKTRLLELGRPNRWDIIVFDNPDPDAEHPVLIKRIVGLPGERIHIADGKVYVNGEAVTPPERFKDIIHYTQHIVPGEEVVKEQLIRLAGLSGQPLLLEGAPKEARVMEADLIALREGLAGRGYDALSEAERETLTAAVHPSTMGLVTQWLVNQYEEQAPFRYGLRKEDQYSVVPEGHYFMLGDNSGNSVDGRFFGWVPYENLYGRAFGIALPFTRWRDLSGFTDTWIGLLLLYGVPLLLLYALEIRPAFVAFSWRVEGHAPASGLSAGDHVFVNRIYYGLRRPFSGRRLWWRRRPAPGDVVAIVRDPSPQATELTFARVAALPAGGEEVELRVGENTTQRVPVDYVVGRVGRVWWPLSRARRLRAGAGDDSGA